MRCFGIPFLLCLMALSTTAQETVKIPLEGGKTLEAFVLEPYGGRGLSSVDLPLFLALPPGPQNLQMAKYALGSLAKAAAARGYLAVVPIARDEVFFRGGADDLPALFDWLQEKYRIDASRSIVAGVSNGGRAAFTVASRWPKRFAGIGVAPGVIVKGTDTKPLAGKPTWMRVGENDSETWTKGGKEAHVLLTRSGSAVSYKSVKGGDHVIRFDADEMISWLESKIGGYQSVKIKSADGTEITGDLYATMDQLKPTILFCHQAGSSRGEYRTIARRLQALGYNGLAIDQRSGRGGAAFSLGVTNQTAKSIDGKVSYLDAKPDIEAALDWLTKKGFKGKRVLWGSSYSSALAIVIGSERKDVDVVCSFAPGEYLEAKRVMVGQAAAKLTKPTLIVSPEGERKRAEAIFGVLAAKEKHLEINGDILHGSRTLFLGGSRTALWKVVDAFLSKATGHQPVRKE